MRRNAKENDDFVYNVVMFQSKTFIVFETKLKVDLKCFRLVKRRAGIDSKTSEDVRIQRFNSRRLFFSISIR